MAFFPSTTGLNTPIARGLADLTGVAVAVSGFGFVLDDGIVLPGGADRHPRTGIGLSADARHAYLLVIDGRRHASQGATTSCESN